MASSAALKMFKLKSMVNCPSKRRVVPDNIFFKERQSQTRKRALVGPKGYTGYVACLVFSQDQPFLAN
jgi:hypothetical protein